MKPILLLLLATLVGSCTTLLAGKKQPTSHTYQQAIQAIQAQDYSTGLDLLSQEQEKNPDNGYILTWMGVSQLGLLEYGQALNSTGQAIRLLPPKEEQMRSLAYYISALSYEGLEQPDLAIEQMSKAIEYAPQDASLYERRGYLYRDQGRLDLAEADFQQIISFAPGDSKGYVGIASIRYIQKNYTEAIKLLDLGIKLHAHDYQVYLLRSYCHTALGQYSQAADDAISSLNAQDNIEAFFQLQSIALADFQAMLQPLEAMRIKEPDNDTWDYNLGCICQITNRYPQAIGYYRQCTENTELTRANIAFCLKEVGDYRQALLTIDSVLTVTPTDYEALLCKASILYLAGYPQKAIAQTDLYNAHYQPSTDAHYWRGYYKNLSSDYDGALADLDTALILDPQNSKALLLRGEVYRQKGDLEQASNDYRTSLAIDTINGQQMFSPLAWLGIGETKRAIATADSLIADEPSNSDRYFAASQLHARLGNTEKALDFLEQAFEKGFRKFVLLDIPDMEPLHNQPRYQELLQKYPRPARIELPNGLIAPQTFPTVPNDNHREEDIDISKDHLAQQVA